MNYTQVIAGIRAEIERLELEHGPKEAWGATFRLLQALEHLQAVNRSLPRLMRGKSEFFESSSIEELAASQGVRPFAKESIVPLFDSDEDAEEFLAGIRRPERAK